MDLLSDPVLISNIWGAIGGAVSGLLEGRRQRSHARHERKRANRFSARQAATTHQREVEDLKKAGLNPILSAGKGGGAPAMAGQMAAPLPQTGAAQTAMQAARTTEEISKIQQETNKLKEEIQSIPVARDLTEAQQIRVAEEATKMYWEAELAAARTQGEDFANMKRDQQRKILESNEWLQGARAVADSLGIELRDFTRIFNLLNARGAFQGLKGLSGTGGSSARSQAPKGQ